MEDITQSKPLIRQFARAQLDLYINKIVGDEPHLVRVRDISAGGVYLYKLLEPTMGANRQQVGLELKLPNSEDVIWAIGEVVREEGAASDGTAIRFVRIAEHDRLLIQEYVETMMTGDAANEAAA